MDPKILFRLEANEKVGYGHLIRSIALAEMLYEDFSIIFAFSPSSQGASELMRRHGFDYKILKTTDNNQDSKGELQYDLLEMDDEFQIAVLDGYGFGEAYTRILMDKGKKVVQIDDFVDRQYFADMVICHVPGMHKDDFMYRDNDRIYALGLGYALLRKPFRQIKERPRKKNEIKDVLLCFGMSDVSHLHKQIIINFGAKNYIFHILGNKYLKSALTLPLEGKDIRFYDRLSAVEIKELMMDCDFSILSSSTICLEAIACGLPFISVLTQNNQRLFHNFLEKEGFPVLDFTNGPLTGHQFDRIIEENSPKDMHNLQRQINQSRQNHISNFKSLL